MTEPRDLEQNFDRVTERVDELRRRAAAGPAELRGVVDEAIAELLHAVEKLSASDEELRQQGGRLAGAVKAIETERQRYLDLFTFAPDGYLVTDAYGLIQEANEAVVSLLGRPATRLVGRPLHTFVAEADKEVVHGLLLRMPLEGRSPEHEIRVIPAGGGAVPVALTATVVRDDAGRTTVRWLLRDVTERHRAAEALARTEAQARAFLETAPIGVVIVDGQGVIVSANAHLGTIFGYANGVLEGQRLEVLLPERLRDRHRVHRGDYFAAPRSRPMGIGMELVGRRADGSEMPIEVSLSFVDTPDGGRGIAFVSDVTRRHQAERRQRAEFAVTSALVEAPTVVEAMARVVRAVCDDLDWDAGEFWLPDRESGGLRWQGLWHGDRLDPTVLAEAGRDLVAPPGFGLVGRTWAQQAPLWVSDLPGNANFPRREAAETLGLQSALGVPVRAGEDMIGVLLFFTREPRPPDKDLLQIMEDIGRRMGRYIEHRRAQEQLAQQREALARTERLAALGTLTAGLAHELNNPLGIISSRIELMLLESQDNALPARVVEDLGVIHRNIQRVTRLGQALRAFSRQTAHENGPVQLNAVVEETALLVRKTFSTENIDVVTALDEALPPVTGDASALQQVLLNLITNAREAMTKGGAIRIETMTLREAPARVRVVVADTGAGIPADVLPRIFDPFYTTKATGTGLGLAVSYGIVQDHKGSVEVQSQPGRGTTFVLTFPAVPPGS
jgi:PAS domain S-box-containing protein